MQSFGMAGIASASLAAFVSGCASRDAGVTPAGRSKVIGEVKARDDGTDPYVIPWLLLNAKSSEGAGIFGKTQSIQRIRTMGGKAPGDGCNQAQAGKAARVAYRATYYFCVARP